MLTPYLCIIVYYKTEFSIFKSDSAGKEKKIKGKRKEQKQKYHLTKCVFIYFIFFQKVMIHIKWTNRQLLNPQKIEEGDQRNTYFCSFWLEPARLSNTLDGARGGGGGGRVSDWALLQSIDCFLQRERSGYSTMGHLLKVIINKPAVLSAATGFTRCAPFKVGSVVGVSSLWCRRSVILKCDSWRCCIC